MTRGLEARGLTLFIPAREDEERDLVAQAFVEASGEVVRLDRFWEPPPCDPRRVRLYGNDTFCLVLAHVLGIDLVSPPDDFLAATDPRWVRRRVAVDDSDDEASGFASAVARQVAGPSTWVLDVGRLDRGDWAMIEANAAWGAGLNGCEASRVVPAIAAASAPTRPA